VFEAVLQEAMGLHIGNTPLPPGEISADVIWRKKYEQGERKRGEMQDKNEEMERKRKKEKIKIENRK
jgi:hypothetical protein